MAESRSSEAPPGFTIWIAVAALLVGYAFLPRLFQGTRAGEGQDAPDFAARLVANGDGQTQLKLSDLKGKAVVLDFWATWCGPCQAEAPLVDRFAKRHKDDVVVIGVNTSDEDGRARPWAASRGIGFPIVFDDRNAVADAYRVVNLPTLVVVSRSGKIVAWRQGITDDAELERLVRKAL